MLKYSLGLDISAQDFHACLSVIDQQQKVIVLTTKKFANTKSGFTEMHNWITKHRKEVNVPLVVCMEATGIYHEGCAYFMQSKEYAVSVILPNKSKNYIKALGVKTKNDKADAQHLARMGAEQSLELWQPHSKFYYELRELTRQHQNCQELKSVFNNQLLALGHGIYRLKIVEKQLKKNIAIIEKQLKELETATKKHIESDVDIARKVKQICLIKGVALHTASVIIAETNGFALIKNYRQLVSYSGYDVVENQSGSHVGKTKISKKGNSRIRRALFMPAFTVVTHNQKPFADLFKRTYERHKVKMKSYVAVQKKLLTTIYALWKSDTPFNENYKHELSECTVPDNNATSIERENLTDGKKISPTKNGKAKQGSRINLTPQVTKVKNKIKVKQENS